MDISCELGVKKTHLRELEEKVCVPQERLTSESAEIVTQRKETGAQINLCW